MRLFNTTPFKIILTLVLGIVVFANLWQGLFIDENGLLVIYHAIYQGERMFIDSWGEYHMASILLYPMFALYHQLLEPLLTSVGIGLVLYTRIVYVILRLLTAIYLYFTIKKTEYKDGAYLASLFYFLNIVGWRNFSYKSICDFGLILLICFIIRYALDNKSYYFVLMGIASCICILAYPTMIVLPFAVVITGMILSYKGYELIKNIIIYSITCFVCGGLFLVYLQLTSGIVNAFTYFGMSQDSQYDSSGLIRIGMMVLSYVAFFVIAYFPIAVISIYKRYRALSEEAEAVILGLYWIVFMLGVCFMRIESVSYTRFIYGCLVLFFWFPFFNREDKTKFTVVGTYKMVECDIKKILWLVFIVSTVAQTVWALSTNQDISVPGNMAYYVVIILLLILNNEEIYGLLITGIFVAEIFFACIWLPENNGGYSDVFETRYFVTEGALQGIALSPEDYEKNEQVMEILSENVTPDDYLLVAFGFNSTAYLNSDAHQAAGSPYMRPQVNDLLLKYWEANPQNVATLVLIDKGIDKYPELLEAECGQYILSQYTNVVAEKGDFVLLSK